MSTHQGSPAIVARDLVKTYPRQVRALDGLSIDVAEGETFGLLGPNGAGKSTTVKILTTLARPDSGTARVAGEDVRRRPDRVRRLIGVVSQRSGADPVATGRENLLLQGRLYRVPAATLRRRVDELLERFGLADAAGRKVRTYSGGMRRRLDVALGLVHRPRVLFLDEPTTGLDPEARAAMWEEIARLAREERMTILLTTHYLDEADRLADRLAIVDRGRVVTSGTPDELKGQLHGDAIHIELSDAAPAETARATLAGLSGVREVAVDGRHLSARADSGAATVPAALTALERSGIRVATVSVSRPSLDDVYLRHAGRRLTEAEAGAGLVTTGGVR
jgi:ABC-2 type transport system ATP-binding protein